MRKLFVAVLVMMSGSLFAAVSITNNPTGSGQPGGTAVEGATRVWSDTPNVMHAPQYLPGYPTAATIWPRVVDVKCVQADSKLTCDGYNWTPELGRGEYLFFRPVIQPAPTIEYVTLPAPPPKEIVIIREVPAKKKGE